RIDGEPPTAGTAVPTPQDVQATGYDRDVEVSWNPVSDPVLGRYVIYRSVDGKAFEPIGIQVPGNNRYTDFLGKSGVTAAYKIAASDKEYRQSDLSNAVSASTRDF